VNGTPDEPPKCEFILEHPGTVFRGGESGQLSFLFGEKLGDGLSFAAS
jgi:hypothetical protein